MSDKLVDKENCNYCGKSASKNWKNIANWEMQHLHFSNDEEILFFTCDKCKMLSPMKFLEKIQMELQ